MSADYSTLDIGRILFEEDWSIHLVAPGRGSSSPLQGMAAVLHGSPVQESRALQ